VLPRRAGARDPAQSGRTRLPRAPRTTLAESDFRDGNHDGWNARGGCAELCKENINLIVVERVLSVQPLHILKSPRHGNSI
jgi:hypothetical protein